MLLCPVCKMSHVMRKSVFGVCDQVRLKPAFSVFEFRKKRYYSVKAANNKGADQIARMRRLICAFVVRIWQKKSFSRDVAQIIHVMCVSTVLLINNSYNLSRLMTKQTKRLCAQRRIRSAWASAQSDQSLRCALHGY